MLLFVVQSELDEVGDGGIEVVEAVEQFVHRRVDLAAVVRDLVDGRVG